MTHIYAQRALARVWTRRGEHADARDALQTAITLYEAKGDITGVAQARARLEVLHP